MAICITIFGLTKRSDIAMFCYGFIRPVRGTGNYPALSLPKGVTLDGVRRVPINEYDIEIVTWDVIIDGDVTQIDTALKGGTFMIPTSCPIDSGMEIVGNAFGPILIMEDSSERVRTCGSGLLQLTGIACNDGVERIKQALVGIATLAATPAMLTQIIDTIATLSGLGMFFKNRRRLGIVDYFARIGDADGELFIVHPQKLDPRSREPMRQIRICRAAAASDCDYLVHVILKNFDDILSDFLVDIPKGQSEITCEAGNHITEVTLYIFDNRNKLIDHIKGVFIQEINFGLIAQGRSDDLPKVFTGAPFSTDLEKRVRIHTSAFRGPTAGDRAGGLDIMRRLRGQVDELIGTPKNSRENVWFERGGEGQINVIRWIKAKFEKPGVTKAYLVDPYLGSDALKRVISRQGSENLTLTIIVSPGGNDPDAEEMDIAATNSHIAKLRTAADEWADRLCGQISILHIRRGEGKRQAFHDRYLSTIDQQGIPTVYLLSNSLNKAAGDWPFAISEFDRIASWQVQGYIEALIAGKQDGQELHPETIWKSAKLASLPTPHTTSEKAATINEQPEWVEISNILLDDLWNIVIKNNPFGTSIHERIELFLKAWPKNIDTKKLAEGLFKRVGHRDEAVVAVSKPFAMGTPEQIDVAQILDDLLLERFIAGLPRDNQQKTRYWHAYNRNAVFQHIGQTIARKEAPANTNFVRNRLNPIANELVQILELQRFDVRLAFEALEIGVFLVCIALEVALKSETAEEQFRLGIAKDYIYLLARLLRSAQADGYYEKRINSPNEGISDLKFAITQVMTAHKVLGEELNESIRRLHDDPFIPVLVKTLFKLSAY